MSSKALSLTLLTMFLSNSVFCMEKEKKSIEYPTDLHPKALRRAFETGKTDNLYKKHAKETLQDDEQYYKDTFDAYRKKLLAKKSKAFYYRIKKISMGLGRHIGRGSNRPFKLRLFCS